ncbi:MAG: endonuclease/exonuclease/phosphatase family protein [Rubrivivax sp.]|nr:endonuclease/exonuclease/phosphatase family protein [Rubrivivax sp.]
MSAAAQRNHVDIVTWNVQWFCGLDGQVDVSRVVAHAKTLADFDVLCLQEVAVDYPELPGNAGFDQPARVREALGPGYEVFYAPAVDERGPHGRRQQFGNLLATRLPAALVQCLALPWPADGEAMSMPRVCLAATLVGPFGPLRVMTTHLEYYSKRQRLAQANALRELHAQACERAAAPPLSDPDRGPFRAKPHTASAVLCGDFNFEAHEPEYAAVQGEIAAPLSRLADAWPQAHPGRPQQPTFRIFDRRYGPDPIACDFFFTSADLLGGVQRFEIDGGTRLSDHQPMWLRLGAPA